MADHDNPGEGRVLPAGPDTPFVRVRGRRRAERAAAAETGRRRRRRRRRRLRLRRRRPLETQSVVDGGPARGRGQHPKHPVHRVPGAYRVSQAVRAPIRDMREHVERASLHVRPAGEPEGARQPAQRVRVRHHGDDSRGVRGQRPHVRARLRAQAKARAGPPQHPAAVLLPERRAHVPPGPVGVALVVAHRQRPVPAADHAAADGAQHVHVRVLDVRGAVHGVRAAVHGAAHIQRAQHHHPRAGAAVLQPGRGRRRRRPGQAATAQRQQVRVLVRPHRPAAGQHHTRQHGRGHVRDPAVHAGGRAPGVFRVGRRPVRRPRGQQKRHDHHAVRGQGQFVPAQQPARDHQRSAVAAVADGHGPRPHLQSAQNARVSARSHRQPDRAVHRVHVADRPQSGHVVLALASG